MCIIFKLKMLSKGPQLNVEKFSVVFDYVKYTNKSCPSLGGDKKAKLKKGKMTLC